MRKSLFIPISKWFAPPKNAGAEGHINAKRFSVTPLVERFCEIPILFIGVNWYILLLFFANIFISCQVEPKPIEYGSDACSFCSMTIVDRKHASEIVTGKGKAFKYDSIECMMRDLKNFDSAKVAFFLVSDFAKPGKFINAKEATYLISENIPSPMGANLSAFKEMSEAKKVQARETGDTFTWQELQEQF